jgi:hypothetical protein
MLGLLILAQKEVTAGREHKHYAETETPLVLTSPPLRGLLSVATVWHLAPMSGMYQYLDAVCISSSKGEGASQTPALRTFGRENKNQKNRELQSVVS